MPIKLEVWGDLALFTRPEMKVERVSYDVMTPSAARGILEAIYWHPGMRWVIDRIRVCSPIRFSSVRVNELTSTMAAPQVRRAIEKGRHRELGMYAQENIAQRTSLLLRDVHYVIEAHFDMTKNAAPDDSPEKFHAIISRRIQRGQCYHTPYFGCRDYPVKFALCEDIPECAPELSGQQDLGYMLYDMDYSNPADIRPMFFRAVLHDGVLEVPRRDSKEVLR